MLEGIQAGHAEDVLELLEETALLQLRTPRELQEGRGREARAALSAAFGDHTITGGRQIRGDLVAGVPTVGAVLSYALPDGSVTDALLLVTVRGQRIARLVWTQLPPRPAAPWRSSHLDVSRAG